MPATNSLPSPEAMTLRGARVVFPRSEISPLPEPERSELLEFLLRGLSEFKKQNPAADIC